MFKIRATKLDTLKQITIYHNKTEEGIQKWDLNLGAEYSRTQFNNKKYFLVQIKITSNEDI